MIYCFKKLRELKLTHIFFLHYAISLIVGGAAIAGLFVLGGGLQFYSVVVLCYMYSEPAILMLRRMDTYRVKAELRNDDLLLDEKIEIALEASVFSPTPDLFCVINIVLIIIGFLFFLFINIEALVFSNANTNYYPIVIWQSTIFAIYTWIGSVSIIQRRKRDLEG